MNADNLQPNPPKKRAQGSSAPSLDGFLRPAPTASKSNKHPAPSGPPKPGQSIHPTQPVSQDEQDAPPINDMLSSEVASQPRISHNIIKPLPTTSKLTPLPDIEDEDPRPAEEPPERNQGFRDLLSVLGVLVCALLLAGGLIKFVFQSYQVEGPSMQSTLEDKDHLIVWKVDKTIASLTGHQYVPNRGDVIIFDEPIDVEGGFSSDKQLIKRVIGLPGERVVYRGTDVIIHNKQYPDGYYPDKSLPYGNKLINKIPTPNIDVTLGSDEIFVSGDHRDNSLDSRIFGPLKTDQIVGKLVVRVLPLDDFKLF